MMPDSLLIERLSAAAAVALLVVGAIGAWTAPNVIKRAVAIVIACIGAILGCAGLGAPPAAMIAGAGVAFAYTVVAVSVIVRLQESYGGVEAPEIDREEAEAEREERAQ